MEYTKRSTRRILHRISRCRAIPIHSSLVEGVENQKGEIEVHAQILPDMEEIKLHLGKEPTDEELDGLIRSTIKRINARIPAFKRIRSFTIRKNDFERTTA